MASSGKAQPKSKSKGAAAGQGQTEAGMELEDWAITSPLVYAESPAAWRKRRRERLRKLLAAKSLPAPTASSIRDDKESRNVRGFVPVEVPLFLNVCCGGLTGREAQEMKGEGLR